MPLFSPTRYTRPEEKPEMTMAWVYIMIRGMLGDDPTKWAQQIIYIGQCSTITPERREAMHKTNKKNAKVMKDAKMLVVKRFDRENENGESAEMQSLMWEFLLSAHSAKMKLISNSPGNFANRGRMSLRAEKLAEEADDDLLREVAEQLETILQDEKAGRTKEETFKFKCSHPNCDYESIYLDDRNRHEGRHNKSAKPEFACQFCAEKGEVREFLNKESLTNHIRVAHEMPDYQRKRKPPTNKKSKENPVMYECPHSWCTSFKPTNKRDSFGRHMKRMHGMGKTEFDEEYPSMIKRQGSRNKHKKNQQQNSKIIVDMYSDISDDEREKRQKWADELDEEMDEVDEEMDEEDEEMDEVDEEMDEEDIVELTDDEVDEAPPNKIQRMDCVGTSSTSSPIITID